MGTASGEAGGTGTPQHKAPGTSLAPGVGIDEAREGYGPADGPGLARAMDILGKFTSGTSRGTDK